MGNGRAGDSRDRGTAGTDDRLEKRKKAEPDTAGEYEDGGVWGIECYFGKRKSGKTTRMGIASRSVKRLLWFDGRGDHSANLQKGFEHTFHQPGPLREFLRSRLTQPFRVIYQPILPPPPPPVYKNGVLQRSPDLLGLHFAAVTTMVIGCGRMIYAIDEIDRVTSAGYSPPGLDYLINQGRHVQVSLECSSRRPAQVPRELTSQSHRFVIFKMTEPADLDYLEKYIGKDARNRLPALHDYRFLEWEETDGIAMRGGREKNF